MACFKSASPLSVRGGGRRGWHWSPRRDTVQSGTDCFLRRVTLICLPLAKTRPSPEAVL